MEMCDRCKGSGKIEGGFMTCSTCGGLGQVDIPDDDFEEFYDAEENVDHGGYW